MTETPRTEQDSWARAETAEIQIAVLKLIDRLQEINCSWLDRMLELQSMDAELGAKLLATKNPADSMSLCNQWMAKRLSIIGAEQQTLVKAWLEIGQIIGKSAKVPIPVTHNESREKTS